jgi:hypothetical protein
MGFRIFNLIVPPLVLPGVALAAFQGSGGRRIRPFAFAAVLAVPYLMVLMVASRYRTAILAADIDAEARGRSSDSRLIRGPDPQMH